MTKRSIVLLAIVIGAAVAAAAIWQAKPWEKEPDSGAVLASGTVDATQVGISFRVAGTLGSRPVHEGSVVKVGDVLAELDTREAGARLRQAQAAEQAALARLKDLEQGHRPYEIAEAKAQAQLALATLANQQEEARRSERLFEAGAVSRQRRDKDQTAATVAREQAAAASARLKLLQSGFREDTIKAARAQAAEAGAAVEAARVALEHLQATSTIEGIVTRKHAEPGETLGAGRPVLTITDLSRPWVRVYIPENQIGKVRIGAPARIQVDTFPGRDFSGRVSYVSSQAEFTPKNVQTREERVKLVFAVDVAADNPDGALKPGMPADVYIDAAGGT